MSLRFSVLICFADIGQFDYFTQLKYTLVFVVENQAEKISSSFLFDFSKRFEMQKVFFKKRTYVCP